MLGNLAISVICAVVYGVTAVILGLPYALALALIAGILDVIPNIGSLIAGIIIGIVALSVSLGALIAFVIVILVYQQVENYILQPTIIGKAADVSGFTVSLCSGRSSASSARSSAYRSRPRSRSSWTRRRRGGGRESPRMTPPHSSQPERQAAVPARDCTGGQARPQ
jgi:hypothetical protein